MSGRVTWMGAFIPGKVRDWLMRFFPAANTNGIQIHGMGCPPQGPCAGYCRCWCHGLNRNRKVA